MSGNDELVKMYVECASPTDAIFLLNEQLVKINKIKTKANFLFT